MDYRKLSKAELLKVLQDLENSRQKQEQSENIVEELHVHQVELEMQNQELQEAQLEIEAARDRYQSLFDFAPVNYFTFDARGHIVEMNLAAQELLGRKREECIGAPFYVFIAPGHVREFLSHLRQSLLAHEQLVTELPVAVSGKEEITLQLFSLAMPDPTGVRIFCRSAMIDVTERRKLERQLQESEERYRRLFYPISDAVLLVDQGTETIIDNNAAAITLYGYTTTQMVGMRLSALFVEEDKSQLILENPTRSSTVLYQRKQNGDVFPAEISVYRFVHRGLMVAGVTIRDLTGQRRKDESRRQEEEQFRMAVKSVPLLLAIYDREGRYRFVSAEAEELLQKTNDDLRGKRDEECVPEEVRREYLPLLRDALMTKSTQAGHCVIQTRKGPVEAFMRYTPLLDDTGDVSQIVAIGVDPAYLEIKK